ncbi:hypothetical protein COV19_01260 [Candidatus Woesearchaeota archaeon CG10_big_fil_rev_8_21_14_0_10_44_13]|nr:MAG: hypothetical protein COV19_01260 [Candidatus Woesearchaeota archaeon CG10_big_fil_rev_8_21_14_0_10_44_13]
MDDKKPDYANVLVVDDEPLVLKTSAMIAERMCNLAAHKAGNRSEAITLFNKLCSEGKYVGVLITDNDMPQEDEGIKLIQELKAVDPSLYTIIQSGRFVEEDITRLTGTAADSCLSKPVSLKVLAAEINKGYQTYQKRMEK